MGTTDLGNSLYNSKYWDCPIQKPFINLLGIDGQYIELSQIPFKHKNLKIGDLIINNFGDELRFQNSGYEYTGERNTFLYNWFSKWQKK